MIITELKAGDWFEYIDVKYLNHGENKHNLISASQFDDNGIFFMLVNFERDVEVKYIGNRIDLNTIGEKTKETLKYLERGDWFESNGTTYLMIEHYQEMTDILEFNKDGLVAPRKLPKETKIKFLGSRFDLNTLILILLKESK